MNTHLAKQLEKIRQIKVYHEPAPYEVPVKIEAEPIDLHDEWWLLGPFRSLQGSFTGESCASPERCAWELGPMRCPNHPRFG